MWLAAAFASVAGVVSTKVQRNGTGQSQGFGFVTFIGHTEAEAALQTLGAPGSGLRLAWAPPGGVGVPRSASEVGPPASSSTPGGAAAAAGVSGGPAEFSLFVGDVAPDVTDALLVEAFRARYPAVRSAKVVTDAGSGRSKGFGFVRFGSAAERDEALVSLNGFVLCGRPMRISLAAPKKAVPAMPSGGRPGAAAAAAAYFHGAAAYAPPSVPPVLDGAVDPTNTTVFVGGLDAAVTEDELRAVFDRFGELVYVKIPHGKNCGFVQFVHRACAEAAIAGANGAMVGRQQVRLSWGRSNSGRGAMAAAAAAAAASYGYGYGGGYGGGYYGYAQAPPQPGAYYAYPGYGYESWGAQMAAAHYAQYAAAAQQGYAVPQMSDAPVPVPVAMPIPVPVPVPRVSDGAAPAVPSDASVEAATNALRAMLLLPGRQDAPVPPMPKRGAAAGPPAEAANADA